jgi:hypothetical protein
MTSVATLGGSPVNLTTGAIEYKPIPDEWARKYIGTRDVESAAC